MQLLQLSCGPWLRSDPTVATAGPLVRDRDRSRSGRRHGCAGHLPRTRQRTHPQGAAGLSPKRDGRERLGVHVVFISGVDCVILLIFFPLGLIWLMTSNNFTKRVRTYIDNQIEFVGEVPELTLEPQDSDV